MRWVLDMKTSLMGGVLIIGLLVSGCADTTNTAKNNKNSEVLANIIAAGLTVAIIGALSKKKCNPGGTTMVPVMGGGYGLLHDLGDC